MVTEQAVLDALRVVMDPDLGRDIVSLGFIKDLAIEKGDVSFTVELTTPACPVRERFKTQCEQAVGALPGVRSVTVTMSARQAQHAQTQQASSLETVNTIIAVSACKGGVGKSTIAVLLARALREQGLAVGLLDADLFGPSLPTLLNLHQPDVYMQAGRIVPVEANGMATMSFGYLIGDSPAVMRGPMVAGYIEQILTQTEWGRLDCLVIDMPPGTGDIQLTITQRARIDGAVIVTTPQALSLADVAKGILMFEHVDVPVLGLVENMSHFVCDGCGKEHYIFGSGSDLLQRRFGLPTLARIPVTPGISSFEAINHEPVPPPIRELCDHLTRELGKRRAADLPKPAVAAIPGHLHIRWPDGSESVLPNVKVRAACSCARCVNEYTGEAILDPSTIPSNIEAETIQPLGHYAVSIAWSDGHASGIFTWDRLRELTAN